MFRAIFPDGRSWRSCIEAIAALIDEGTLQLTEGGLRLRAMDPSQIAMINFELPKSAFEEYELEKPTDVGIDFSEMLKISKRCRANDRVELGLDDRFRVTFRGETVRRFAISIIEAASIPPREPSIDFTAQVRVAGGLLKEALRDAELVSGHVALELSEGLRISSESDTGSISIEVPEESIIDLNVRERARAVFSLEQLANLLRAAEAGSIVTLHLKTDAPLKLEYQIGEGKVTYYLAPRIESV